MNRRPYFVFALAMLLLAVAVARGLWGWSAGKQNDPAASFQRGLAAIKTRDVIALHREIEILKRFPKYLHHMQLLRGTVNLDGNDYSAALNQFSECSLEPETKALALTLAGETLCRLNRQGDAIQVLEQAVEADANSLEAHRWLAIAYYDTGAVSHAAATLKKVANLAEDDYRPHRMLGLIQKDRTRHTEAVQEYKAALRLFPKDFASREKDLDVRNEMLQELSESLVQINKYDEALKYLDEALESADAQALRANCYFGMGERADARRAAERALELEPNHIEGRGWMAKLEMEAGHFQSAADHLEVVVAKYPTEFEPRFKLSQAYQRLGRKADAERELAKAKEYQALRLKFTELHDKASQNPKDRNTRLELAEIARKIDRPDLAKMWDQAARSLDPQYVKPGPAPEKPEAKSEDAPAAKKNSSANALKE